MMTEQRSSSAVTVTAVVVAVTLWLAGPGAESVSDSLLKIACEDMTPRHPGYKSENVQNVPCPYRVHVDTPVVVPGGLVNITLTSVDGSTPFKGFMIQGRDESGDVLGSFLPDCVNGGNRSHHMISCSNGVQPYNTVVHSKGNFKVKETITWVAPVSLKGPFKFKYTVVLDFKHFWVNEETDDIPVLKLSPKEYKIKSSVNHEYYIYKLYTQNCRI